MGWRSWLLPVGALVSLSFSVSLFGFDALYLKMKDPVGWRCYRQLDHWQCDEASAKSPRGVLEVEALLVPNPKQATLGEIERQMRSTGAVKVAHGKSVAETLVGVHRVRLSGIEWIEAVKDNSMGPGISSHQWTTVVATPSGPMVILMLGLIQHRDFRKVDTALTAAVKTVHITRYAADYADYLSLPENQREISVPHVAAVAPSTSSPHCAVTRKLEMTVGVGRLLAFPLRLKGVVVSQASESLALLPVSLPYVMSSILLSPMTAGDAGLYLFDRDDKCRVHYTVSIRDDATRNHAEPREWTSDTKPVPDTMQEAHLESGRLEAAILAGHLEAGNPVNGIAMPPDASIWVSDPRIVDTIEMRPPPKAKNATLALIARHPGTTTVAVIDPNGGGRAYRIEVTAKAMRVSGTEIGQYESGI